MSALCFVYPFVDYVAVAAVTLLSQGKDRLLHILRTFGNMLGFSFSLTVRHLSSQMGCQIYLLM